MRTISVVNQKGGVAKTTTCANLGACLALKGYRTLLIDMDPQANLTLGLKDEWPEGSYRLSDVLLNPESAPLSGIVRQVGELPLFLAPGHMSLAQGESMLMPLAGGAYRLKRALEALDSTHELDWVLIDCPPSLGTLTQNAIVASTHLLIPTEPKFYAFAGIDILNRLIVSLTQDLRFQVELLGVVLTLYERNTTLHRTIATEIRERFGSRVLDTVIYKNVRIAEAEVEGLPVRLFDKRARGSENYEALTDEILRRIS